MLIAAEVSGAVESDNAQYARRTSALHGGKHLEGDAGEVHPRRVHFRCQQDRLKRGFCGALEADIEIVYPQAAVGDSQQAGVCEQQALAWQQRAQVSATRLRQRWPRCSCTAALHRHGGTAVTRQVAVVCAIATIVI